MWSVGQMHSWIQVFVNIAVYHAFYSSQQYCHHVCEVRSTMETFIINHMDYTKWYPASPHHAYFIMFMLSPWEMHSILRVPNSSGGQCYAKDETDYCTSKINWFCHCWFFGGENGKGKNKDYRINFHRRSPSSTL